MLSAYGKAIGQLNDNRFLMVVVWGIIGAIAAMIALWSAAGWALDQVAWAELPLFGGFVTWLGEWADDLGWLSFVLGAGGLTWLLFPVTAIAVISLFLDSICEAVEQKHYPERTDARSQPLLEAVFGAVKFLGITIALNLIALPIYLFLLLAFGTGAFLFIAVNGYLVSREFFEIVAARRMPPRPARRLRKAYTMRIFLFGLLTVFMMTIPVLNIIVPVLAAAAMVHLYESLPRKLEFEAEGFDDNGASGTQFGTDAPASGNLRN